MMKKFGCDTGEIASFPLRNNRFAAVNVFRGETKVHLREFSDQGNPTTKGICQPPSPWTILVKHMDAMDNILGGGGGGLQSRRVLHPRHRVLIQTFSTHLSSCFYTNIVENNAK